MKEFAFGTEEQYNWLENLISDGQCHVFNNCVLPSSCTPDHARLGFDKLESVYAVYIDHGVTTTAEDPNFARFLQDGETKFMSMEDMSEFFHSLQPLFNTDASASSVCTEKQKENSVRETNLSCSARMLSVLPLSRRYSVRMKLSNPWQS